MTLRQDAQKAVGSLRGPAPGAELARADAYDGER